jgi:hypothetical protein
MTAQSPRSTPADGAPDAPNASSEEQPDKVVVNRPMRSVKCDILSIDGHAFPINYGVPQEVTDRLTGLFTNRKGNSNVTYDDIPEDLKANEVVVLDGHRFRFNSDVPDDVKERLRELQRQLRARTFKYEDLPEDLMVYHVNNIRVIRDGLVE